jgi:hypothetical protein
MAYLRYFDQRYGDLYEVYFDDETGAFESATRSTGNIGNDIIYYDSLGELPTIQREQIEHLIWQKLHPKQRDEK